MSCGIYKIQNTSSKKIYIGQSINIERRWRQHIYQNNNSDIHKDIKKYGANAFSFEILEECDELELNEREIYWISYYNSFSDGYNGTKGGTYIDYRDHRKPVIQFDSEFNFIKKYDSITIASEETGIALGTICAICKNRQYKTREGYIWKYADEVQNILNNFFTKENEDYSVAIIEKEMKIITKRDLANLLNISIPEIKEMNFFELKQMALEKNFIIEKKGYKIYYTFL